MYSLDFCGGVDYSNKFLLNFILNRQEVSFYTMKAQGLLTTIPGDDSPTSFVTNHRFMKLQFQAPEFEQIFFIGMFEPTTGTIIEIRHPFSAKPFWLKTAGRLMRLEEVQKILDKGHPSLKGLRAQQLLPKLTMDKIITIAKRKTVFTGRRIVAAKGATK